MTYYCNQVIKESKKKKRRRNTTSIIPMGGSIPTPVPPKFKTYHTICDNGSRKIPHYYLGGRRVNLFGLALDDSNRKFIENHKCRGCDNNRCNSYKYYKPSTSQKIKDKKLNYVIFPKKSPYYMGPLKTVN